jgi:hypothetical protein
MLYGPAFFSQLRFANQPQPDPPDGRKRNYCPESCVSSETQMIMGVVNRVPEPPDTEGEYDATKKAKNKNC